MVCVKHDLMSSFYHLKEAQCYRCVQWEVKHHYLLALHHSLICSNIIEIRWIISNVMCACVKNPISTTKIWSHKYRRCILRIISIRTTKLISQCVAWWSYITILVAKLTSYIPSTTIATTFTSTSTMSIIRQLCRLLKITRSRRFLLIRSWLRITTRPILGKIFPKHLMLFILFLLN